MSAEGYLVAGRYRIGSRVGSGAMGIVWQALDERLGRTVAVKQLLVQNGLSPDEAEEAKQRIMREGRIAARLHHQNAVAIYDVVDDAGSPCLVMEYLPSRSLDDVLHEEGALAPHEVARIGAGVAAALAAAHSAGIVHRDIKPANVLLGEGGVVKITDFGISRATDDVTVTKTGLIAGTPAYLAPEVAIGREPKPPSDVFSLGSTLYAAVEGVPPFGLSENTLGLLHAVAAARVNPPQQAGPLTDVLMSFLRAEPDDRPDARQAAQMLDAVAHGQTPDIPPAAAALASAPTVLASEAPTRAMGARPGPRGTATQLEPAGAAPPRRNRKRMWAIIAAVLAVIAAIVIVLLATNFFSGQNQQPQPSKTNQPSRPASSAPQTTESSEIEPTIDTQTEEVTPQQPPAEPPPPPEPPPQTETSEPTNTSEPTDDSPPVQPPDDGGGSGDGPGVELPVPGGGNTGPDNE